LSNSVSSRSVFALRARYASPLPLDPGEFFEHRADCRGVLAAAALRDTSMVELRRGGEERRVDCGELDPGAVIRPAPAEWHPHMPKQLDEEELANWRAGRNAVYQLAALAIGARLAVADA
jgi:hypothetical protein